MTPSEIMHDLARDDMFPRAAMAAAREDRDTMAPIFVDLVTRLATQDLPEMRDDDMTALIPVFHMLGEFREPRAYRPLLRLLRQPSENPEAILGDALTETSFRVIAGTFDGDLQPLFEAIEDPKAYEFSRAALMDALVLIAQLYPDRRATIEDYVRTFRSRHPEDLPLEVLIGWMDAIANLGLEDMTEEVRAAFEKKLIPPDYCDFSHFLEDLQATQDADGAPANRRYQKPLITDAIDELSRWHGYSDAYFAELKKQKARHVLRSAPSAETFMHETPPVGRNDPCPCGSGKKFKKCCLH
ncbi:DUF1186 domain-containing protein [Roseovarius sp. D22-M7]|uniref:DUF1186 domain-containing protein n=1 Tax=Roseovarius sp. D22-M7 TaxID=3127116 RepID=UPI0030104219